MSSSTIKAVGIPKSLSWLTVFVPALAYFLATRLQSTRLAGRALGPLIQDELVHPAAGISSVLFVQKPSSAAASSSDSDGINQKLQKGLHLVQSDGLVDIVDTTWKHDGELGRGFVLLSQSSKSGRIWRWEVGGGPIAIGKTLFMEASGCRSKPTCTVGSGAVAVDFHGHDNSQEGRLVVAEWGENRIIRVEETGARTPLVLNVPSLCSSENTVQRRIYRPTKMMFTPFGDLVFVDTEPNCHSVGLYLLPNAMQIPPIGSPLESRRAHKWTELSAYDQTVKLLHTAAEIGGLALDEEWTGIYVSVKSSATKQIQLLHLDDVIDDDDEDDIELTKQEKVVHTWEGGEDGQNAGPLAMDGSNNFFTAVQDQLYILHRNDTLGQIKLPAAATSVTLAEDGFLYVASPSDLYRMKTRSKPMKVPTNLVRKTTKTKS